MQLKELYEKGIISKDELTAAKAKIFAKEDIQSPNTKPTQNKNLIRIIVFTVVIALLIGAIVLLIRSNRNPADPDPVEEIEVQTETVQEEIVPEDVIPFNHLILCHPLLPPPIFPSIRIFSNESALHIR